MDDQDKPSKSSFDLCAQGSAVLHDLEIELDVDAEETSAPDDSVSRPDVWPPIAVSVLWEASQLTKQKAFPSYY